MTLHPNCATLDATILDALRLMDSGKFLHVPVLDGDGMLITCLDVLQLLKLRDPALDFDPQDEDHSLSYASIDRLDIKCMTPSVLELIMLEGSSKPTNLPFTLLQDITNNFSDERTIGYGGFGIVFKGVLQNGCVAVKKLFNSNTIEDGPFHHELRGLEWHARYQIIRGICEGLLYLHTEKGIVHMDLKPANILLNDLMVPKITDFGISRHLDGISRAVTKERLMSLGYCAPEYIHQGELSFKSDIYALGVIIKELVTGRKEDPNIKNVLRRWRHRWNKSAKCPPLGRQQVNTCIELAVRCMAEDSKSRPFIWEIVNQLNNGMESTEDLGSSANESTADQISPYEWELLSLDPLELCLPLELTPRTLELTNERGDHIAFVVHTTNAQCKYRVEPSQGVVPPRSRCGVTVTLLARHKAPVMPMDQLAVRMARVEEGVSADGIDPGTFDAETGGMVDEVDLTVVFTT
uniref:Uncharacterized protein n=1 Tax=Avena sativa TaxID=4498 RepID=A0ACD5X3J8_AVESA